MTWRVILWWSYKYAPHKKRGWLQRNTPEVDSAIDADF